MNKWWKNTRKAPHNFSKKDMKRMRKLYDACCKEVELPLMFMDYYGNVYEKNKIKEKN